MNDAAFPDPDGTTAFPVGTTLTRLRRAAGLTGHQLGALVGMSQAKISRIETGSVSADPRDVELLARKLGASDEAVRLLVEQAHQANNQMTDWRLGRAGVANRQREVAQLEAATREVRVFQPAVIIGLLQTSEYARAILTGFEETLAPALDIGSISEAVSARVQRHEVLAEPGKEFRFVMSESVLSYRSCGPLEMLAQIQRVREVARQDNVTLGLIPADSRLPLPLFHGFELLDDRCVIIDLFNTELMSRGRSDTQLYRQVFDSLERISTTDIDGILDKYLNIYLDLSRPGSSA
jgi:transcriptional regulator with XRE-family HTH domain